MWSPQVLQKKDSFSYDKLISGKIPALIIPNVISKSYCTLLSKKILGSQTHYSGPEVIKKLGTSLSSHIYEKSKYFSNAHTSNQTLENIFFDDYSPIDMMQQNISKIFQKQISTAKENGMNYSNSVIRIHENGDSVHLHRDNSNFEMSEYSVSKLENQLSAILYLQSPTSGGNLSIFKKFWNKKDETMRKPDFGYSLNVVKNIKQITIPPTTGNMVLFNPKLYHQIDPVYGVKSRITIGFFFGELTKKYLCSWA